MVTLRSGKAVPYLGKNVPKRKTVKKTKKINSEPSKKPNDSKLSEKPDKSTTPNFQMKSLEKETTLTVQATVSASNQPKLAAAVQNEDQPVVVFDDSNPIPVDDFNGVPPYHASTSRENEFSVSLNDMSGTTYQSKHSVLDESSDDSAETMIDDSFEITDYDYDQLQHDSTENNEAFQMQEPAVRICLPVRGTTSNDNKEPNVSRAENGDDNNDDNEVKRKPLTDLCSVTNISWF